MTLKLGSLSHYLTTDLPQVAIFHCSLPLSKPSSSPACPLPHSVPACRSAGWAPAWAPLAQPRLHRRPQGSAFGAGWSWPGGQWSQPQLQQGGVRHCQPARARVCKCPMPYSRDKTPGWAEITSAPVLQGGRKARAGKQPRACTRRSTGVPQPHRNGKSGFSILSLGVCVRWDGEAKGSRGLYAVNCSLPWAETWTTAHGSLAAVCKETGWGSRLWLRFNEKIPRSVARASAPAAHGPAWPEQLHGAPLASQLEDYGSFLNQNTQFCKRAPGKLSLKLQTLLFLFHLLAAALRQTHGWNTEPALATARICNSLWFMGAN